MRVLVSDSSVLIEFAKRELLDRMFKLPFEFSVPDLLFDQELIDLGRYSRQDLLDFGLRVEALNPDGVTRAISYPVLRPALSLVDCFCIALAFCNGYTLLTEDRRMRALAQHESITHYGVLWLIDQMHREAILPTPQVAAALEAMLADPRCPVPNQELIWYLRGLTE